MLHANVAGVWLVQIIVSALVITLSVLGNMKTTKQLYVSSTVCLAETLNLCIYWI